MATYSQLIKQATQPVAQTPAADAWKTHENPAFHTTAEGQTLDWMAKNYGTTSKAIMDLNPGLKLDKLQIGQKVNLPKWTERRRIWETNKFDPEDVYPLDADFLKRMRWVETSNKQNVVNKIGATGPLQFMPAGLAEVNNIRAKQNLPAYTMQDMQDWTKAQDAAQTLNTYWGRQYQYQTGNRWLNDMYARRHNVGNNWENNDRGLYYLSKIYSDATSDATGLERIPGGIAGAPAQ